MSQKDARIASVSALTTTIIAIIGVIVLEAPLGIPIVILGIIATIALWLYKPASNDEI